MGRPTGFLELPRQTAPKRPVAERTHDWREVYAPIDFHIVQQQGARCMDCGIPFCHQGCPLGNMIPDWNDLVYRDHWRQALDRLHATNNFPEFTGRLCPAPCESSCVLAINQPAVAIKQIEVSIIDYAWEREWVGPEPPAKLTGKRVGIIGSGPAGLAAAQQLRRAGHEVVVMERADQIGGLLIYGIPEFKMEKRHLHRRLEQMTAEGVQFRTGVDAGGDVTGGELMAEFDALILATGATDARDLPIPGREFAGIYQAMHFLPMANHFTSGGMVERDGRRWVRGTPPYDSADQWIPYVDAKGKKVIIIGGGDTGADCLGTVVRQGCESVVQFEINACPPEERAADNPWPQFTMTLCNRSQPAHDEGCEREWEINTIDFTGDASGCASALRTVRSEVHWEGGRPRFTDIPGTERTWPADLVLLALGFTGPERGGLLEQLGVQLDGRGNVKSDEHRATTVPGVFTAGDAARGQSLIVWAIAEGRQAAAGVDAYLMGESDLPRPLDGSNMDRPFI